MNLSSKTGSRYVVGLIGAVLLMWVPPLARAQNGSATVAASLVDPSVEAGQSAEYHIEVINGQPDRPPPAPQVDGLTISFVGRNQSRQVNFGNGFQMQQTVTFTYVYSVETTRAGRFTIPGQQIDIAGTALRTLPVTLTVLDGGTAGSTPSGQTLSTELIIPKRDAYVGESIPVEVCTYFGLSLHFQVDPDPILNGEGFSVQKFVRPRMDTQVIEGMQVHVASYKTAITGVKTGDLSVGPVEVQPVVQFPRARQRRQRYNDPFDDPFFSNAVDAYNMAPAKQVKLSSGMVHVEIKPLPPDQPANFSGAIGSFKLDAEVIPRKAQAGDPITVRLMLSGQGNFDRIAAPILLDDQGLRTYPATAKFKGDDELNLSGTKTFEQVVIADGARSSLPSYHFDYLDPATGKYLGIDTPPLSVEIVGGSTPAATPGASSPATIASVAPTPVPTPKAAEDILYIRTDAGASHPASDFLPPYRRRSFWLAQGGVAVVLLGIALLAGPRAHARSEQARRLAQALRQQAELERALKREATCRREFYSSATQLVRLKAGNGSEGTADSLSVADICRVSGLDAQAAGSVEQIFRRHDELAYSGEPVAQEPVPPDERRVVLNTLKTLNNA